MIIDQIIKNLKQRGLEAKYGYAGVYGIYIDDQLVYIGKSTNMLGRIANHIYQIEFDRKSNKYKVLRQAKNSGHTVRFDVMYYSQYFELEDQEKDIGEKEGEFIRRYLPILNYQIPKREDYKKYSCNKIAKVVTLAQIINTEDKYRGANKMY